MVYNLDLHVHSMYSWDSTMHPEKIIKIAQKKGLSSIAVVDHNTVMGAIKTVSFADDDFIVIIGSEISTDKGDVIGLFLNENITSRNFMDVIDEIKDQGAVSILPHPYKNKRADPAELIRYVNLVEGLNARVSKELNNKACALSDKVGMRLVAGSDAHMSFEVGRVQTILTEEQTFNNSEQIRKYLLTKKMIVQGKELPSYIRLLSAVNGKYKKDGIAGLINAGLHKV